MRYDRPQPVAAGQADTTTWADIFASNEVRSSERIVTIEAVELLRDIVEDRVSIQRARSVGAALLREMGVIA